MRTIQSELTAKGFSKSTKNVQFSPIRRKAKEKFSERELKELMGCNKSTYARGKGGAFKQR